MGIRLPLRLDDPLFVRLSPEALEFLEHGKAQMCKEKYPNRMSIAAHDGNIDTAPVGCYLPNEFGLYDMHGNVWEWCSDGYAANYYNLSPRDDPRGASGASNRVFRGGDSAATGATSAVGSPRK